MIRFRAAAVAIVSALFCAAAARACSIPVFRYALDRWPADRFRLELAAADAKDESIARFRRNFTDSTPLNLTLASLPEGAGTGSRLLIPHPEAGAAAAWSGKLDAAALATLSDSPARQELARRILAGESCVWVFVESGNAAADRATAAQVEKRLRYLEQIAQIPPIDPGDPSSQLGPGPALGVKFSLLRVRRDDPAEQPFLAMLAGAKATPQLRAGAWLATVFGRGRVLGAWPAAELGDEQIDEVCLFLLGACSCQVKRENPGWDLLLNVDWDEKLQAMGLPAPAADTAPATTAAPSPAPALETVTIAPATSPASPAVPAQKGPPARAAVAGLLLIVGASLVLWVKKKP